VLLFIGSMIVVQACRSSAGFVIQVPLTVLLYLYQSFTDFILVSVFWCCFSVVWWWCGDA
jgi:hypothetical protein